MIVGLTGNAYQSAAQFLGPFREAMWICTGMFAVGGVMSAVMIRNRVIIDSSSKRSAPAAPTGTCAGPIALCGEPVLAHTR